MREFLHNEIANWYGIQNFPDHPDIAIRVGKSLCEELLEPLQDKFGRIAIRSAYRSPTVNQLGNEKGHNCASNEKNFASHIWDYPNEHGYGATACIMIPSLNNLIEKNPENWKQIAYWIHNNLPYSHLEFFKKVDTFCAFNIGWHENPFKEINSYVTGSKGKLKLSHEPNIEYEKFYPDL